MRVTGGKIGVSSTFCSLSSNECKYFYVVMFPCVCYYKENELILVLLLFHLESSAAQEFQALFHVDQTVKRALKISG